MTLNALGRRGLFGAAVLAAAPARAAGPDPAITTLPDWSRVLGDGVRQRPTATPARSRRASSARMSPG